MANRTHSAARNNFSFTIAKTFKSEPAKGRAQCEVWEGSKGTASIAPQIMFPKTHYTPRKVTKGHIQRLLIREAELGFSCPVLMAVSM